jgi:hypothetical protein
VPVGSDRGRIIHGNKLEFGIDASGFPSPFSIYLSMYQLLGANTIFANANFTIQGNLTLTGTTTGITSTMVGLGNCNNTSDANKPISTATQSALLLKANTVDVYTKTQSDTSLALKANSADVYAKPYVYMKTEVDTALALKAPAATTYSKTQVDTSLASKANSAEVYTKTESDTALLIKSKCK